MNVRSAAAQTTVAAPLPIMRGGPSLGLQHQCACGGSAGLTGACPDCQKKKLLGKPLQTKLRVNEPDDQYEQEADRVAEQVMRMPNGDSNTPLRQSIRTDAGVIGRMPILQRAEEGGGTPATEGDKSKEEGGRCPSWRGDPQSISKRAGEFYARNHLTPPSQATVERIECEPPIANGNYGCYVHFSDGLVLRVLVRETDIVVGTGPGPITTEHPPPATPLCFYEYSCPDGDLVLTVKKCQSAKPSGSSSPPAVAQRKAASGAPTPMTAPPIVQDVLNSPGQPLDAATRAFLEPRFGHDFSKVRVHTDERAEQSARNVNAHAYTVGHDIAFGAGQYSPHTADGRRLIAHELTHVLQQGTVGHGVTGSYSLGIQRQGVKGSSKPPRTETEGCNPSLQSDLKAMHHPARDHVERAIASLDPGWKGMTPANRAAFSQYFDPSNSGQIDGGFVRTVRDKYKLIHSTMRSLRFDCDPSSWTLCGTSKKWCVGGRLMWTCFGNLHVCSNAYKSAASNDKIETIIHESVHNALLTTDRAYSNESGFKGLSPRGTGFWGRVLNFLSNIPVLGILFRLLPGNKDTMNNPDSYAGYAMQV